MEVDPVYAPRRNSIEGLLFRPDIRKYAHRGIPPEYANPTREILGPIMINSGQRVRNKTIEIATAVSAVVILQFSGAEWKRRVSR